MELFFKIFKELCKYACFQWKNHIFPNICVSIILGLIIVGVEFLSDFNIKVILDSIFSLLLFYMLLFVIQLFNFIAFFAECFEKKYFVEIIDNQKQSAERALNDLLAILSGVSFSIVIVSLICHIFFREIDFIELFVSTLFLLLMLYLYLFFVRRDIIEEIFSFFEKEKKKPSEDISKGINKKRLALVIYYVTVFVIFWCSIADQLKKLS